MTGGMYAVASGSTATLDGGKPACACHLQQVVCSQSAKTSSEVQFQAKFVGPEANMVCAGVPQPN